MDETNNISKETKYRKTDLVDTTIVVLSVVASSLAFAFGYQFLGLFILAISIGYFAKLIVLNSLIYAIIAAILGFGLSVLISYFLYAGKTLSPSIIASSFIFAGVTFGLCVIFNKSKSFTCLCTSIVIITIVALAIVYELVMKTGSFNIANFSAYYDNLFVSVRTSLMESFQPLSERYANVDMSEYVDSIISIVKSVLVGIIIFLCEFVSILSTTFFNLGIKTSNAFVVLPTEWKLFPHRIGGILLLTISGGTFIFSLFITNGLAFTIYAYLLNIIFVLSPQYIMFGISKIILRKRGISFGTIGMLIFMAVFGVILSPIVLLLTLSSWGAFTSILVAKTEEQLKKDENKKATYEDDNDRRADEYFNSFNDNRRNDYYRDDRYSDKYSDDRYSDEYNDNNRYSDEYSDDRYSDEYNDKDRYSDEYNDDRYSDEYNDKDRYSDEYNDDRKKNDDEDERRY